MPHLIKNKPERLAAPEKLIWWAFLAFLLFSIAGIAGMFTGNHFWFAMTYVPLLLLAAHSFLTLSVRRGLAFMLLAGFVGFVFEWFGLKYGTVFGGQYTYPDTASLFTVPWGIIAYWAIFIYMGYWLVTTFLYWLGKTKPSKENGSLSKLALLVLADGLAVTALDLFMDPVKSRDGAWHWVGGGPYFGVPIGNFIGWFLVTIIVTGLFRLFEYYRPQKRQAGINPGTYTIPIIGYLFTAITFLLGAVHYRLVALAVIGVAITILPALINLALYIRFTRRTKAQTN